LYVNGAGDVITTAEAVNACTRVTIDSETEVDVSYSDADIAVLTAKTPLSPAVFGKFGDTLPRLKSDVAAAGFSYEGALGAPTVTFGTLADVRGLNGETTRVRLALNTRDGDTGGPVLDQSGAVLGMLLTKTTGAQQLPQDVQFAVNADTISGAGVAISTATTNGALAPEDLTQRASEITVLVECWSE
jgi:S1-C subfamily serine protease